MQAYIFQAALLCGPCGEAMRAQLTAAGKAPNDPDNESDYDSGDFPKGPYADGGGEADSPQHCDHCQAFLENPLTADGYAYVREALESWVAPDDSGPESAQADGPDAYARFIAGRIEEEAEALKAPALNLESGEAERNAKHAEILENVSAVWADFYREAWDSRNGGPCQ